MIFTGREEEEGRVGRWSTGLPLEPLQVSLRITEAGKAGAMISEWQLQLQGYTSLLTLQRASVCLSRQPGGWNCRSAIVKMSKGRPTSVAGLDHKVHAAGPRPEPPCALGGGVDGGPPGLPGDSQTPCPSQTLSRAPSSAAAPIQ